jgi:hypothetical protein
VNPLVFTGGFFIDLFGNLWDIVLLSGMKKAATKKAERNGKVYVGAWIDKEVEKSAQTKAKKDKRTFSAYLELALYDYNSR